MKDWTASTLAVSMVIPSGETTWLKRVTRDANQVHLVLFDLVCKSFNNEAFKFAVWS